jgi:hypothetical protein
MTLLALALLAIPTPVGMAQSSQTDNTSALVLSTSYPSQVIGINESPTIPLTLRATGQAQIVSLKMKEIPDGWTATFRGGSNIVNSVCFNLPSALSGWCCPSSLRVPSWVPRCLCTRAC